MSGLPGIAGTIAEVIGLEATVRLLRWRGGCEIAVPVRPEGSALARAIGEDAARALVDHFGPGKLLLPMAAVRGAGARRVQALTMLRAGASLSEVALACDLHTRTVSRLRAQLDAEGQPELPFDS